VSITTIMGTGLSALSANQLALKATSTNVANVNTVGYARLDVQFVSRQAQGGLQGVEVEVTRIANAYLAAAEMRGAADVAAADILSRFMDRAQGLLGDPSDANTVFAALDPVFSSFGGLSVDPASALRRSEVLSNLRSLLDQLQTTSGEIAALREEAHARAIVTLEEANTLMAGIAKLNTSIQRNTIGGLSASEATTEQARMLDRLSEIIDIRTQERSLGGVEVRTTDGLLLVDLDAARLALDSTSDGEAYAGVVMLQPRSMTEVPMGARLGGGELKGLLRARDKDLVDLALSFGEFAAGAADALNAAHNAASAVPAPAVLSGRNTGLIATDRLSFTGAANLGIVDGDGVVLRNYRISFGAVTGTITDDLGAVTSFANSVGDFQNALNTALGVNGSASFSGGALRIATTIAGAGLAMTDDPVAGATRAGKGLAHTFGLNDLVAKQNPLSTATGLSGVDLHGFSAGQTISFAMRNTEGVIVRTVDYTVGAATTIAALRGEIDTALSGLGQTVFDANGRLSIEPSSPTIGRVDVLQDVTVRGDTGFSLSQLFGLGETLPAERARGLQVRSDILANPSLIGVGQADLAGVAAGVRVLAPGDGRGALRVEAAGSAPRSFASAGGLSGQVTSVADYAARLAGHAGVRAEALEASRSAAESVRAEVRERRMSEEGVNLDEELVKMTTYQQGYAAASRLIQAAKDLYDIVLQLV